MNSDFENEFIHSFEVMGKELIEELLPKKQELEQNKNMDFNEKTMDLFYWNSVFARKLIEHQFDYARINEIKNNSYNEISVLYHKKTTLDKFFEVEKKIILNYFAFIRDVQQITDNLIVNKILNYLYWHIEDYYSLDDLIKELNLSKSYASKVFKEHMHNTIIKYGRMLKIERAQQLIILNPKITVVELSKKLGFYDISHFSKTFKNITGLTPIEYKKNPTKNSYITPNTPYMIKQDSIRQ